MCCVLHRGGISAATGGHSVVVVCESDSVLEADLAGVVRRARGIRSAAARAGRDAADVSQIHPDVNIRVVGRAGGADDHGYFEVPEEVCSPTERVRGSDRRLRRGLCGRVARRERQRRPVRAVRRGARRVGGNERHAQSARRPRDGDGLPGRVPRSAGRALRVPQAASRIAWIGASSPNPLAFLCGCGNHTWWRPADQIGAMRSSIGG